MVFNFIFHLRDDAHTLFISDPPLSLLQEIIVIINCNLKKTSPSKRIAKHFSTSMYALSGFLSINLSTWQYRAFTGTKFMSLQVNALI